MTPPNPTWADRLKAFSERAGTDRQAEPLPTHEANDRREELRARWDRRVPARFADVSSSKIETACWNAISGWVEHGSGPNLVLVGPVGVGKTAAAVVAARRVVDEWGVLPMWTTARSMLDRLSPGRDDGAAFALQLRRAPLLLLDDVGDSRDTDWARDQIAGVICDRYDASVPVIVTANLTLGPAGSLAERIGERAYSRLVGEGAVVVRLAGEDRRRVS